MDIVFISELRVDTIIGIHDWERETLQTVILDLELASDIRAAAISENIQDTLDYHAIAEGLESLLRASRCLLLETLVEQCATYLHEQFGVSWLRLRINKPGALSRAKGAGVMIERTYPTPGGGAG